MHKHFQHTSIRRHLRLSFISALLLCFGFTSLAAAQTRPEPFRFGEVDLEFLDQIKQLAKKFGDRALVYREPELNAFVDRVGRSLLKPEEKMENVVWRLHVMRNPAVNAFALANGSIYVFTGLLARVENGA